MLLDFSQNGITALFEITEQNTVILRRLAREGAEALSYRKPPKERWLSIVDVAVMGEDTNDHHGAKHTGASSLDSLRYVTHRYLANDDGSKLEFDLRDARMQVTVHYQFYRGVAAVRSWTVVTNLSDEPLGLEYVSSFAVAGLSEGERSASEKTLVYIPHNAWCRECDWKKKTLTECGLESSHGSFSMNRVNVFNTGFWSTKEYLPMGAVENTESRNLLLFEIEANGSWQWELGDIAGMLYLKLSGPTEQESHWYKELSRGESFETVKATVAVGTDFDTALAALTDYRRRIVRRIAADESLPVIFNDYMNCLRGDPTEEKVIPVIDRAAETGAEYYCMDAGWYASRDGSWWDRVGEWEESPDRFPHGLRAVFDYIRSKGMKPGIWLELEVIGVNCALARELPDECFIMRHGKRVIDHGRYVLDFRNETARRHATRALDRVIAEYGARYIKTDYNVEAGIGTDLAADSCGDGLLGHCRAFKVWCDEMREKYPDVIIENCASGGMRMDYLTLDGRDIQSVTDQTNYLHMAPIAAAVSTAVLPEQAAIWTYPKESNDRDAVAFNMVNALLHRIHLSGTIAELSHEAFALVTEGIALYKSYRDEIPLSVPFYPIGLPSYSAGWLASGYRYPSCSRVAVWRLSGEEDTLMLPIACGEARVLYPSNTEARLLKTADGVAVTLPKQNTAVLLELK